jgi:hypothetical protein
MDIYLEDLNMALKTISVLTISASKMRGAHSFWIDEDVSMMGHGADNETADQDLINTMTYLMPPKILADVLRLGVIRHYTFNSKGTPRHS